MYKFNHKKLVSTPPLEAFVNKIVIDPFLFYVHQLIVGHIFRSQVTIFLIKSDPGKKYGELFLQETFSTRFSVPIIYGTTKKRSI